MMQAADLVPLVQLFKETADAKRREDRWIDEQIVLADERQLLERRDREKREAVYAALEQASKEQIAAFREQLDRYDTATVQALMENERRLDEARKRQDELLERAYKLPDGRKAFKSEDGLHVLDQNGREVGDVDPQSIPDSHPKWEAFKSATDQKAALAQQREELLKFQQKVDQARDKFDHDGTTADLDALSADLKSAMPDAVKHELGESGPGQSAATKPGTANTASADFRTLPDLASLRRLAQPNMQ